VKASHGFARVHGRPRILGHRGVRAAEARASTVPPENTIAAFEQALREGAEGIELDVRVCATGELVVLHDPTLTEITAGADSRAAHELPWSTLARVPLASADSASARIPLLVDVLAFARAHALPVNIELKRDAPSRTAIVTAAARLLGAWDPAHAILVSSFDPIMLAGLALLAPRVPRAILVHPEQWRRTALAAAIPLRVAAVHLEHTLATPGRVARFHAAGMLVNAWTVNDADEARRLATAGVDGLITDVPAVLHAALG
jgi:glycerophosphoryl diester phosphodiesterase